MSHRRRGVRELCRLLGYTSQAYYQYQRLSSKRALQEDLLIGQVLDHRRFQPRVGGRKLLEMLDPLMKEHQITMGRDAFFSLLDAYRLLVRKRKRRVPQTTFSNHLYRKYDNLTRDMTLERAQQLWVSDITYIPLKSGHAYLSLVTDAYSRKIVGFFVSPDLTVAGCLKALNMALGERITGLPLIHHSDRGGQYCSIAYTGLLNQYGIAISMTQSGDPRDNPIAERVNGILKSELLTASYTTLAQAEAAVKAAIDIYNHRRLHSSVNMLTPAQAHLRKGELKRRWKNYYASKPGQQKVNL
jgi:transposase InsO family protein